MSKIFMAAEWGKLRGFGVVMTGFPETREISAAEEIESEPSFTASTANRRIADRR
jgi:hypothetical protein